MCRHGRLHPCTPHTCTHTPFSSFTTMMFIKFILLFWFNSHFNLCRNITSKDTLLNIHYYYYYIFFEKKTHPQFKQVIITYLVVFCLRLGFLTNGMSPLHTRSVVLTTCSTCSPTSII